MTIIEAKVVGYRPYEFTGRDGETVGMVEVLGTYPSKNIIGSGVLKTNLSRNKFDSLKLDIGKTIHVMFYDKRWHAVTV